jgi:hypothetical protein
MADKGRAKEERREEREEEGEIGEEENDRRQTEENDKTEEEANGSEEIERGRRVRNDILRLKTKIQMGQKVKIKLIKITVIN